MLIKEFITLELEPFGIDVIDVVPGGVRSNLANSAVAVFNKTTELKLYKPYEEAIIERAFFFQKHKPKTLSLRQILNLHGYNVPYAHLVQGFSPEEGFNEKGMIRENVNVSTTTGTIFPL
ncbi:unnamed protein product [Thlaspi arvense]|uniref:Uncharacterized protein n=1 Tax=Thlaspi arvense TaxID=13288 RepID=A0AAU9SWF7_THLAR|nr:unnamed protein product [Thlaspi arvense]